MKIGIIIIFRNNEKDIEKDAFINQLRNTKHLEFCMVNNSSQDKTYQLLKDIKEVCGSSVSIVDIKRHASEKSAIRAGARYLFNHYNLKHIGYISTSFLEINNGYLNNLIETIFENKEDLIKYNIETLEKQEIKLTLFQGLFSIVEYFKKIRTQNQFDNFQWLS